MANFGYFLQVKVSVLATFKSMLVKAEKLYTVGLLRICQFWQLLGKITNPDCFQIWQFEMELKTANSNECIHFMKTNKHINCGIYVVCKNGNIF